MKFYSYNQEHTEELVRQASMFINTSMALEVFCGKTTRRRFDSVCFGGDIDRRFFHGADAPHAFDYHDHILASLPQFRLPLEMEKARSRYHQWQRQRENLRRRAATILDNRLDEWDRSPGSPDRYFHTRSNKVFHARLGKEIASALRCYREDTDAGLIALLRTAKYSLPHHKALDLMKKVLIASGRSCVAEALKNSYNRFRIGVWVAPVWNDEHWWQDSPYSTTHVLHASEERDGMVAFAQNPDKLTRGVYTRAKPGRYLQRYFSSVLSEEQIRFWSERQQMANEPLKVQFIESNDPDGWEWVYENSILSCMRHNRSDRYIKGSLTESLHPVRVYARSGNGLRLAYAIRANEKKTRSDPWSARDAWFICARAIVNAETGGIVRIYFSDDLVRTEFRQQLEKLGYFMNSECLLGVRLNKTPYDHGYVMPYLDGEYGYVEDHGNYFVVSEDGRYEARNSSGYMEDDDMERVACADCDATEDVNDMYYIDAYDTHVCEHCYESNYVDVIGRRGLYTRMRRDDDDVEWCEYTGEYYNTRYLADNNIGRCDNDDELYPLDNLILLYDGNYYYEGYVDQLDYPHCGELFALECDTVTLPDGKKCHEDDEESVLAQYYNTEEGEDEPLAA